MNANIHQNLHFIQDMEIKLDNLDIQCKYVKMILFKTFCTFLIWKQWIQTPFLHRMDVRDHISVYRRTGFTTFRWPTWFTGIACLEG